MLEAKNDLKASKDADRIARTEKEKHREDVGCALVGQSLARATSNGEDNEGGKGRNKEEEGSRYGNGRGKRRKLDTEGDAELGAPAATMRETDMASVEVEQKRLALEREGMERETRDRIEEQAVERGSERLGTNSSLKVQVDDEYVCNCT